MGIHPSQQIPPLPLPGIRIIGQSCTYRKKGMVLISSTLMPRVIYTMVREVALQGRVSLLELRLGIQMENSDMRSYLTELMTGYECITS